MSAQVLRSFFGAVFIVAIQVVFLEHLTIFHSAADLVFVFGIWLALRSDRTSTLLVVAFAAFLQDALSDTWGIHLISNTLYFYLFYPLYKRVQETVLTPPQVFMILLASATVFHLIMLSVAEFSTQSNAPFFFWQLLLSGSLFTAIVGTIAFLLRRP